MNRVNRLQGLDVLDLVERDSKCGRVLNVPDSTVGKMVSGKIGGLETVPTSES